MKIEFPLLSADQISVKVKQVTQSGAVALLYKSARVDMDLLDEVVGPMCWQDQYREIKGNLYCSIGIYCDDRSEWIWKEDCGIESAQDDGNEKKAEASDAFKRAGFRWGIGRELYTSPFTFLKVETKQNGSRWELVDKFARFKVSEIGYTRRRITRLVIVNENTGAVVFSFGKKQAPKSPAADDEKKDAIESATPEQIEKLRKLFPKERIEAMCKHYNIKDVSQLTKTQAAMTINARLKAIEKQTKEEMK